MVSALFLAASRKRRGLLPRVMRPLGLRSRSPSHGVSSIRCATASRGVFGPSGGTGTHSARAASRVPSGRSIGPVHSVSIQRPKPLRKYRAQAGSRCWSRAGMRARSVRRGPGSRALARGASRRVRCRARAQTFDAARRPRLDLQRERADVEERQRNGGQARARPGTTGSPAARTADHQARLRRADAGSGEHRCVRFPVVLGQPLREAEDRPGQCAPSLTPAGSPIAELDTRPERDDAESESDEVEPESDEVELVRDEVELERAVVIESRRGFRRILYVLENAVVMGWVPASALRRETVDDVELFDRSVPNAEWGPTSPFGGDDPTRGAESSEPELPRRCAWNAPLTVEIGGEKRQLGAIARWYPARSRCRAGGAARSDVRAPERDLYRGQVLDPGAPALSLSGSR